MSEDDFDVNSLATYLHLTPAQVEKMASRDQLPGRRVGGQWRFSKSEIHHWFEDRIGLSDETELEAVEKVLDSDQRDATESLSSLLDPSAMWIPLQARTRNSVISQMCTHAADAGLVWDAGKMESAIKSRESLHPTALENGVAMLHPRRPQPNNIREGFVGLALTSSGLPFGGPRGVLTDVFFLIASADEKGHLQTLARLSRLIAIPEFLPALRACASPQQAWELIRDTDAAMD